MALQSFNAYHSYLKSIEPLNDAERGRLFTALLEYSSTGTVPELRGNERFVFPMMKEQIDRDKSQYIKRCEANRQNINIRWNTNVYERIPSNTKNTKDKDKDKNKDKDKDKDKDNKENSPNGEQKKVDAVFAEVYQAWERASGKCASIAQSEELQALLEEHGRENMLYAIKQGVNHNAVTLAYIKAVLRGGKSSGKRDNKGSGKGNTPVKSYIPNKQGKFADITDDLL